MTLDTLQDIVHELRLTIVPFTAEDWTDAVLEYSRRRRSSADRARFGDCLNAVVAARVGAKVVTAESLPGRTASPADRQEYA